MPLGEGMGKYIGLKCEGTCSCGATDLHGKKLTLSTPFPGAEEEAVPSKQGGGRGYTVSGILQQ